MNSSEEQTRLQSLKDESRDIMELCQKRARFLYDIPAGSNSLDITDRILEENWDPNRCEVVAETGRRFIVFRYQVENLSIKGGISFCETEEPQPLLLYFRGGVGLFGIPHPLHAFPAGSDYTSLWSVCRGAEDGDWEWGDGDVLDMAELCRNAHKFSKEFGAPAHDGRTFLLGDSRGGLLIFLALARYPEIFDSVSKVVCNCSPLSLDQNHSYRPDMIKMLTERYGELTPEFYETRDPIKQVSKIPKHLSFLLADGAQDTRIEKSEANRMHQALIEQGIESERWNFPDGNHCLKNIPDFRDRAIRWLLV